MSDKIRKQLLDTNYWYEIPGLPETHVIYCANDLAYELSEATKIQKFNEAEEFLQNNHLNISKTIADLICNDLSAVTKNVDEFPPAHFIWQLSVLLVSKKISSTQGKQVFAKMLEEQKEPFVLVKELNLSQSNDSSEMTEWCKQSIANNERSVTEYKSGKTAAINALIGGVMKLSKGKANPPMVKEILTELLK